MNIITNLINLASIELAKLLDKLKLSNPLLFAAVQAVLSLLALAITSGKLHIPAPFDNYISVFILGIIAAIGPRTSTLVAQDAADTEVAPETETWLQRLRRRLFKGLKSK